MAIIHKQRDEFDEVRLRLAAWGEWLRATKICNLNIISISDQSGGVEEFDCDDAEVTEEILVHLKREIPQAYKVIEQEYYFQSSVRHGAEQLSINRAKYSDMKARGETFVLSYLVSLKNINFFQKSA